MQKMSKNVDFDFTKKILYIFSYHKRTYLLSRHNICLEDTLETSNRVIRLEEVEYCPIYWIDWEFLPQGQSLQ